jgi:hypothetical protein
MFAHSLQKEKPLAEELAVKKDRLSLIIRKHLESTTNRSQTFDELIVEAVGDYMAELMDDSFIPHPALDNVEELLMEDSWDILRKMTYGSLSLEDYRKSRQKPERRKKVDC